MSTRVAPLLMRSVVVATPLELVLASFRVKR
jgi:hypothetical protein